MCRNAGIKFLPWTYMYTTTRFLGNYMIQTEKEREGVGGGRVGWGWGWGGLDSVNTSFDK